MLRQDPRFPDGDRLGAYIYLTLAACVILVACIFRLMTGHWVAEEVIAETPAVAPTPNLCPTTYTLRYPGGPLVRATNPCWKTPLIFDKEASDEIDRARSVSPAPTATPTPLPDVEHAPDLYKDPNPRRMM